MKGSAVRAEGTPGGRFGGVGTYEVQNAWRAGESCCCLLHVGEGCL